MAVVTEEMCPAACHMTNNNSVTPVFQRSTIVSVFRLLQDRLQAQTPQPYTKTTTNTNDTNTQHTRLCRKHLNFFLSVMSALELSVNRLKSSGFVRFFN